MREEPDVFLKAKQGKHSEVVVNLKNPKRDWTERTTKVFLKDSGRLQKPRGSKGVAQEEVPNREPCLPKD